MFIMDINEYGIKNITSNCLLKNQKNIKVFQNNRIKKRRE